MSTANVAAMINHLLERQGLSTSDAAARARCLQWLQLAEEQAWSAGDWWFKRGRQDLALVGGTRVYSLSVNDNRVHALEDGDGRLLTELHPTDFRALVGADATSAGMVQWWCRLERSSTGYPRVEVWPVPTGADTLKIVYTRERTLLADSAGSVGGFPNDWRHVVLLRAEVYAALHLGQQGQADGFMKEYEAALAALSATAGAQGQRTNEVR